MKIIRTEETVVLTDDELFNLERVMEILREILNEAQTDELYDYTNRAFERLAIFHQKIQIKEEDE